MKQFIEPVTDGHSLSREQASTVFTHMVKGEMAPVEIAALLIGLRAKGESRDEIAGAADALRAAAMPFARPDYPFADLVGTGGDGAHTINISTAAAIVSAAMGIPMAKHGNRSISSRCGSADVLEHLGVKLDAGADQSRKCLDDVGMCFFFAPLYHSGLRHAGPVRKQLGMRTMMNVLGPLVNPAGPTHMLMGVYTPALVTTLAGVLGDLGCERALVVHGSGLDEMAVHGPTRCAMVEGGDVREMELNPADAGLSEYAMEQIQGGTPEENTAIMKAILQGDGQDAHNAAVALNAGAMAWVFGKATNLKEGTALAMETLKSGNCINVANAFAEMSHGS